MKEACQKCGGTGMVGTLGHPAYWREGPPHEQYLVSRCPEGCPIPPPFPISQDYSCEIGWGEPVGANDGWLDHTPPY